MGMRTLQKSHSEASRSPLRDLRAKLRVSLVDSPNFLVATRDTGYKTTSLAIAELIDNSLQAGATRVAIEVSNGADTEHPIELSVQDDGCGMSEATLATALTFGGSTRFNDRSSLGRYGMGLPNGALSRARRVEVYTWQDPVVYMGRLDVDELVMSGSRTLPPVVEVSHTSFSPFSPSGTVVRLMRCDRLEYRRVSTIARKLIDELGRIYRRFLLGDLEMTVNGAPVMAIDPLMLNDSRGFLGARQFGDVLRYRCNTAEGEGSIKVRFSELPVEQWHSLSAKEKRAMGVTGSPTVSILRADREIDRGWFFMGSKRRENYDDWWRCEIDFDPILDEPFGITHAKQAIVPSQEMTDLLSDDLGGIGRALNNRVRRRFALLKVSAPLSNAEKQAARADKSLPPLPDYPDLPPHESGLSSHESERILGTSDVDTPHDCPYRIVITELKSTSAFKTLVHKGQLVLALNSRHPFYRDLYEPLANSKVSSNHDIATSITLTVLAAARAERLVSTNSDGLIGEDFWRMWSDVLASFLNARP